MKFEGRRRASVAMNIIPLIDVLFFLLLFFMLSSHFVRQSVLPVELPKAQGTGEVKGELLEVVVTRDGQYLMHDHIVEPGALRQVLQNELAQRSAEERTLRLRGDQNVPMKSLVAVLDAAHAAGASGVDILAERQ
jgi:biopolymer transport protein ExbD